MKLRSILILVGVLITLIVSATVLNLPKVQFNQDDFGPPPPPTAPIDFYNGILIFIGVLLGFFFILKQQKK